MPEQHSLIDTDAWEGLSPLKFNIGGCDYSIIKDTSRLRNQPSWYVQRHSDWKMTERYYTWPDGAFSAVLWSRCKWTT